jgi:hypothetical protein
MSYELLLLVGLVLLGLYLLGVMKQKKAGQPLPGALLRNGVFGPLRSGVGIASGMGKAILGGGGISAAKGVFKNAMNPVGTITQVGSFVQHPGDVAHGMADGIVHLGSGVADTTVSVGNTVAGAATTAGDAVADTATSVGDDVADTFTSIF